MPNNRVSAPRDSGASYSNPHNRGSSHDNRVGVDSNIPEGLFDYESEFRLRGVPQGSNARLDSKYQELQGANPYRGLTYNESPMQQFLSMLGFRNEYDSWRESMAMNAAEYDAQLQMMQYQNEYNSPLAQAQRMRAAGINPDVDGGKSIDSGSAAEMQPDPSLPMQTTSEEDVPGRIIQGVFSAINMATSLFSSIQGFKSRALENRLKQIEVDSKLVDYETQVNNFVKRFAQDHITLGDLPDMSKEEYDSLDPTEQKKIRNSFSSKLNTQLDIALKQVPAKYRAPLKERVTNYFNSSEGRTLHYRSNAERIKSQKEYLLEAGNGYDDFSHSLDVVGELYVDLVADYNNIKAKFNKLRAQHDYEVEEGRDTSLEVDANIAQAQTSQAQSLAAREQAAIAQLEASFTRELLSRLKNVDGPFAKFLLAALLTQAPQMLGNAVNIGAKSIIK